VTGTRSKLLLLAASLASASLAGPHGPEGWARGDLHQHTRYSDDGNWEPEALWARLRETLPVGPRFTVLSDHCDIAGFFPNPARPPKADNFRSWGHTRELRRTLRADQELLLTGQEIGGLRRGHIGAVLLPQTTGEAPPSVVRETGFRHRQWMERIRAAGGLNVVYHPRGVDELGPIHPGTFTEWAECLPLIDLISAWNGYKLYDGPDRVAWDWLWNYWLEGRHLVAVGGSDSHKEERDGEPIPYWGKELRVGFETHPANPHNRVRLGSGEGPGLLDEATLREGLRRGHVTVADWHANWVDAELHVGDAVAGIGGDLQGTGAVVYRIRGFGDPDVYSGPPRIVVEYGRVRAEPDRVRRYPVEEGPDLEVPERDRQAVVVPIEPGDFHVEVPLELGPGRWVVAARVLPAAPGDGGKWKGVQLVNPTRVTIEGR
jgi:hypothetical protein